METGASPKTWMLLFGSRDEEPEMREHVELLNLKPSDPAGKRILAVLEEAGFRGCVVLISANGSDDFTHQSNGAGAAAHPSTNLEGQVTARELEILKLAAAGFSAAEAGRRLYLSESTVKTHLRKLYSKLGVSDRAAAVAEGMRRGLIE